MPRRDGPRSMDYDLPFERQQEYVAPAQTTVTAPAPTPPSEDPGAPPGGGDAGPGPGVPRPPMPTVAPPTAATPVSAGSFARPGMGQAIAPFRSAPGIQARRPTNAGAQFGPGTPILGGATAPTTFSGDAEAGGVPTPEELLRLLGGGQ